MLDIVRFYFSIISKIITDVWGHFEIAPGVNYAFFVIGCLIFVAFISLLKFNVGDNGIYAIKSYRKSREKNSK